MTLSRLSQTKDGYSSVARPGYDPSAHGIGHVHIGIGAFFRAHIAVYSDKALAVQGGDWRSVGVSLRSDRVAKTLNPQNGLYTLLIRYPEVTKPQMIGSVAEVLTVDDDTADVLSLLSAPETKVVTLTITETAYGFDRGSNALTQDHPVINDLDTPRRPRSAIGLIVESLRLRKANNIPSMTILSCDNLPENGQFLRRAVLAYAIQVDADLHDWIAGSVAFPSSMVDRITPAQTDKTLQDVQALCGYKDSAAIETEPFTQWVIEDNFPTGRPAWDAGSALFVEDVAPFEEMKLRMLNGAHSMLAYSGFLSGHRYVRDVMQDPALSALVGRYMSAAAATLGPIENVDFNTYKHDLLARFANPEIAHETYQISMDGTEKLPQRILSPAAEALKAGQDIEPFAFAVAAWMRFALGVSDAAQSYDLRDPAEDKIMDLLVGQKETATQVVAALGQLGMLKSLNDNSIWTEAVTRHLSVMMTQGVRNAIKISVGMASTTREVEVR